MRRLASSTAALLIFLQLGTPLPAAAQESDQTTIDLTWDTSEDIVRPSVVPGVMIHAEAKIVLSKSNIASQSLLITVGGQVVWNSSGSDRLGASDSRHSFHVAGKNRLQRIDNFAQNVEFITITLSGKRCRLNVEHRLKPGFSEYVFPKDPSGSSYLYVSRIEVLKTTCDIH